MAAVLFCFVVIIVFYGILTLCHCRESGENAPAAVPVAIQGKEAGDAVRLVAAVPVMSGRA